MLFRSHSLCYTHPQESALHWRSAVWRGQYMLYTHNGLAVRLSHNTSRGVERHTQPCITYCTHAQSTPLEVSRRVHAIHIQHTCWLYGCPTTTVEVLRDPLSLVSHGHTQSIPLESSGLEATPSSLEVWAVQAVHMNKSRTTTPLII